jgi:hypothetical protein
MKALLISIFSLISITVHCQEKPFDGHAWKAPYVLSLPANWGIERFLLPPFFAPEITYKGVEDIRFTPGWSKNGNDEYWSYAFLWYLDEMPKIDAAVIEKDLNAYYTGLFKINTDSAKQESIPSFNVKTSLKPGKLLPGDMHTFDGSIEMIDYMTRKPLTLNCKVHIRPCAETGKAFLFFELSPKPFEHSVWESLDQLWTGFKCRI